tara:strand:- start:458 stop:793 length:336 start_codon:yes stop_codon:yes gene_type:complete
MIEFVYKICTKSEWLRFQKKRKFYGTKKDLLDGYIHLSNKNQIKKTLKKHFPKKKKLILLKIKTSRLKNLIWEKLKGNDFFPHLYSYLTIETIENNFKISLKKNGSHHIFW